MFIPFFAELKAARVPVSLREYLTLLEGMEADVVTYDVEGFYYLARSTLVKDERHIDRFDTVFSHVFKGVEAVSGEAGVDVANIPDEWPAPAGGKTSNRREKAGRGAGWLQKVDGNAEAAAGGTEGPASGWFEVDRHRRHLALRRLWLQSRGRAHRPGRKPPSPRGE